MKNIITNLCRKHSKLIKYGIIGAFSSSLDFVIYTCLVFNDTNILIANIIGVNVGIFTSFVLNRRYNFKVKDRPKQRFLSFYAVGLLGLALSSGLLYLFVSALGINEIVSKIIVIFIVALFQFILNSRLTFKTKKNN